MELKKGSPTGKISG